MYYYPHRRRRNRWVTALVTVFSASIGVALGLFWRPVLGFVLGAGEWVADAHRSVSYLLSSQGAANWDSPHAIEAMPLGLKYTLLGIAFICSVALVAWGMGSTPRS